MDWRCVSLNLNNHRNFDANIAALDIWEIDIAKKLNQNHLIKLCKRHIIDRVQFKNFVMGLNLMLMLLVATNNDLIGFQILSYLPFLQFSMIVTFLPKNTRQLIQRSTKLLKSVCHPLNLDLWRVKRCLLLSSKSLFNEYLSLQPFVFESVLDQLQFVTKPIKDANFNPVYPIIALITTANTLFIYCYGKNKRSKQILYYINFNAGDHVMSWSPNGKYFYIINYANDNFEPLDYGLLQLYKLNVKSFKFKDFYAAPIANHLHTKYLWLSNTELLYSNPYKKRQSNLVKLKINCETDEISKHFFTFANDLIPCDFDCLNKFKFLAKTVYVRNNKNSLFINSNCIFKCCQDARHSLIIDLNLATKTINRIILVPDRIVAFECNADVLVFCYVTCHSRFTYEIKGCDIDWNSDTCPAQRGPYDPYERRNSNLIVCIVHSKWTRYQTMDDR